MLIAGLGGFLGTCGRYLVGKWCGHIFAGAFPLGTFLVNVVGCLVIGVLFGLIDKFDWMSPNMSLLLVTGFCGGFTTFSTFANDIWLQGSKGEWGWLLLYLMLSIVVGVIMVCLGRILIKNIL